MGGLKIKTSGGSVYRRKPNQPFLVRVLGRITFGLTLVETDGNSAADFEIIENRKKPDAGGVGFKLNEGQKAIVNVPPDGEPGESGVKTYEVKHEKTKHRRRAESE